MANSVTTQVLVDGPRNYVIKVDGVLDTSDVSVATLIDPATLSPIDVFGQLPSTVRIDRIFFDVEDTLAVTLWWDATADVRIADLAGRGKMQARQYGGLTNNAGAGKTGKVLYSTQGWASGTTLSFTLTLECVKQL